MARRSKVGSRDENPAWIADASNRVVLSLIALGRLPEAERMLNAALEAAKQMPDTLGASQEKIMWIKRHYGVLYHTSGDYSKAIKYLDESVQIQG